jgi:hypothetical protein
MFFFAPSRLEFNISLSMCPAEPGSWEACSWGHCSAYDICNFWRSFMIDAIVETGSSPRFISVISEEVSCQLHSGISKAARRFALVEIICNVIFRVCSHKKSREISYAW